MWSPDAIAAIEQAEATRRGTTPAQLAADAIARYRQQAERDGWQVDGEQIEPVTQGGG